MPRQRRHRSGRKNRARHSGLYKLVSCLAIAAAIVAACVIFFRVEDTLVSGNSRYSAQEIIDLSGIKQGDNLISIRTGKVSRRLRTGLPYIQSVTVKKLLPDTVSISVTEATAAAAVESGETWWLIGSDGKLLEEVSAPAGRATVRGITALAPAAGTYLAAEDEQRLKAENLKELLAALEENGLLDGLDSVTLRDDFSVNFVYDTRFEVYLSATLENGMSYWLKRFAAALENPAVNEGQSYSVDISDGRRLRFIPEEK